jgi:hypothetical protein
LRTVIQPGQSSADDLQRGWAWTAWTGIRDQPRTSATPQGVISAMRTFKSSLLLVGVLLLTP